jgi:acetyl esterase/lipase
VPSKESDALRAHFQSMTDRMAANPEMDLVTLRGTLEELHERAAEPTGVTYEEITIDGPAGELPAIWCIPLDGADDRVILYTHGGGFVTNTRHSHRKLAGHLAKATGCRALVLEYRLAPEATFPAQLEDAIAAHQWLIDQGIAAEHIATAGDSAGGNLATAIALKLREDGRPLPAAVVGFSPWYDLEGTGSTMDTNADKDAFVQRPVVEHLGGQFIGTGSLKDPLANPTYADLAGLPPLFLTVGSHETLQDSVEQFADRAKNAGVEVTLEVAEGMQHVYPFMAGRAPEADATISDAGRWLRPKLGLS